MKNRVQIIPASLLSILLFCGPSSATSKEWAVGLSGLHAGVSISHTFFSAWASVHLDSLAESGKETSEALQSASRYVKVAATARFCGTVASLTPVVHAFFPTWPGQRAVTRAANLGLFFSLSSFAATATAKFKMVGTCQEWFDISPVYDAFLLATSAWNLQMSKLKID